MIRRCYYDDTGELRCYPDNEPIYSDMCCEVTNTPDKHFMDLSTALIEGFNEGLIDSCVRRMTEQLDADLKAELRLMLDNKYGLGMAPAMNDDIKYRMTCDIPIYLYKYTFAPLNFITKVIQQDKYTIIIDAFGKKCIVKARRERFDKEKGLMVCLLKYLTTSKGYSEMMKLYHDKPKLEKAAVKGALVSYIGQKDFDKFMSEHGE